MTIELLAAVVVHLSCITSKAPHCNSSHSMKAEWNKKQYTNNQLANNTGSRLVEYCRSLWRKYGVELYIYVGAFFSLAIAFHRHHVISCSFIARKMHPHTPTHTNSESVVTIPMFSALTVPNWVSWSFCHFIHSFFILFSVSFRVLWAFIRQKVFDMKCASSQRAIIPVSMSICVCVCITVCLCPCCIVFSSSAAFPASTARSHHFYAKRIKCVSTFYQWTKDSHCTNHQQPTDNKLEWNTS